MVLYSAKDINTCKQTMVSDYLGNIKVYASDTINDIKKDAVMDNYVTLKAICDETKPFTVVDKNGKVNKYKYMAYRRYLSDQYYECGHPDYAIEEIEGMVFCGNTLKEMFNNAIDRDESNTYTLVGIDVWGGHGGGCFVVTKQGSRKYETFNYCVDIFSLQRDTEITKQETFKELA